MIALQQIRSLIVALCFACLALASWASSDAPLTDYVGIYADAAGERLEIVVGKDLFAVIDEAKYPLTRAGGDHFVARSGDRVLFTRAANGVVDGVAAQGKRHERISLQPSKAASDLAWPRPENPGAASTYRYTVPPDLGDGIRSGAAVAPGLGPAVLEQLVQGVLDGRWADVHGLLIHQHAPLCHTVGCHSGHAFALRRLRQPRRAQAGHHTGKPVDHAHGAGLRRLGPELAGQRVAPVRVARLGQDMFFW